MITLNNRSAARPPIAQTSSAPAPGPARTVEGARERAGQPAPSNAVESRKLLGTAPVAAPTARDRQLVRDVAAQALVSAAEVGAHGLNDTIETKLARIREIGRGLPPAEIAILGGGIAGLVAAYEAKKLGLRPVIYEGSFRTGGRTWTKHFPSGQYHERGAMRIPASHDHTRHYAKELGLELRPFITSHANKEAFYDIRGKRARIREGKQEIFPLFALTPEEASCDSAPDIMGRHLSKLVEDLTPAEKESLFAGELATERLRQLDKLTLREFLAERLSPGALELVGSATNLRSLWDTGLSVFLRDEIRGNGVGLSEVVGGIDQIAGRLAQQLDGSISLDTKIMGLHPREDGKLEVELKRADGAIDRVTHENVICTIPFTSLRNVDVSPPLSPSKMRAMRELDYHSSVKVILEVKERFWEGEKYGIFGGASHSDGLVGALYYPSDNVATEPASSAAAPAASGAAAAPPAGGGLYAHRGDADPRGADPKKSAGPGVLIAYLWGPDAKRLGALSPAERRRVVTREIAKIHPEVAQEGMVRETGGMFWDEYPWMAGGAFSFPGPGQHPLTALAARPEAGIHFAGEHSSYDNGWIQGAMISGLRALEEIVRELAAKQTAKGGDGTATTVPAHAGAV